MFIKRGLSENFNKIASIFKKDDFGMPGLAQDSFSKAANNVRHHLSTQINHKSSPYEHHIDEVDIDDDPEVGRPFHKGIAQYTGTSKPVWQVSV